MKFRIDSSGFECLTCGSPKIEAPQTLTDDSAIHCRGCGERIGSWGEIKRQMAAALQDASRPDPAETLRKGSPPVGTALSRA